MKYLFIILILLSACKQRVCEGSDFVTNEGICIFAHDFDINPAEIQYMLDEIKSMTIESELISEKAIDDIYFNYDIAIHFIKDNELESSGICSLYPLTNEFIIKLRYIDSCLSKGSFSHEMLHVYLLNKGPHPFEWFYINDNENVNTSSLEVTIETYLIYEMCGIRVIYSEGL